MFVVGGTIAFEVMRRIENGSRENAALGQQEGDEQAPDTAVVVEEGVNGLELGMGSPTCTSGGSSLCS